MISNCLEIKFKKYNLFIIKIEYKCVVIINQYYKCYINKMNQTKKNIDCRLLFRNCFQTSQIVPNKRTIKFDDSNLDDRNLFLICFPTSPIVSNKKSIGSDGKKLLKSYFSTSPIVSKKQSNNSVRRNINECFFEKCSEAPIIINYKNHQCEIYIT
jgi:hypothetical protein